MSKLEGSIAFSALATLLSGDHSSDWCALSPSIERLRLAITEEPQRASSLDLAVLLRQALRFEHARRGYEASPVLLIRHPRFLGFSGWNMVGLNASVSSEGYRVSALAWQPEWLSKDTVHGVDARATSEVICRDFATHNTVGDPFLKSLGRTSYRSSGQRAAVRAALSTPAGGTLVIALPTGEGKSMIFQLVQKIGFTGSLKTEGLGVTLVIVPTIALGVNHELDAVEMCGLSKPLAFQGGKTAENMRIAERIADGSQGLCFASPEAACGALRDSLRRAAEAGYLRALVIDEAHLVDQWGTGFRTEFQELSGLRRELSAAARPEQRLRTLLLSATLTTSTLETLRLLFGTDGNFGNIAAVQLRPEPDYWVAPIATDQSRIEQIIEALHHVPRPVVLYVTKPSDADVWFKRLRAAGFRRIRKLHGKTDSDEREDIVNQWRNGLVDIVVGTSAFGLGIDYPHARSVVHACVPETLDRFYQEVGRAGRDGRASLSLIVPTLEDIQNAEAINNQVVIGVKRGRQRWISMFDNKIRIVSGNFAVRIDGRPGSGEEDIDMFGVTNTDWNLRTLTLMARGGLIRLLGTPYPRPELVGDWLEIDILDEGHLSESSWIARIEPVRREGWIANNRNFALMRSFLSDTRCPAEVFQELYGTGHLGRVCSECHICRVHPTYRRTSIAIGEPRSSLPVSVSPALARLLGSDGRMLVTYKPDEISKSTSRRLGQSYRLLQQMNVVKLLLLGRQPFDMNRVLDFAATTPFFVSEVPSLAYSRLPMGPEIVMVSPEHKLEPVNLIAQAGNPRIYVTPNDYVSPDGRNLVDVFGGRTLTLDEFHARVSE